MKTGKELKPGTVIKLENDPWLVQKAEFTKSGRNSAIMKTKLKNLLLASDTVAQNRKLWVDEWLKAMSR